MYASTGSISTAGVLILFNRNLMTEIINVKRDTSGHIIIIKCKINDKILVLCNIYAPNVDAPNFYCELVSMLECIPDFDDMIIGGDFNMVMNSAVDRCNSMHNHANSFQVLKEYIDKANLCDIWRV